jgi:hypothetical protein
MVPPTKVAIPIASIISSLVTPFYDWFPNGILHTSQRKTAEATKPNSSFVLHQVHLQHTH